MRREIRLPSSAHGRLDRALADALGVGRAPVKRAFQLGRVRVAGSRARPSDPAPPGAVVEVELESPAGPPAADREAPLHVLVEHQRLVVVDKPPGVAVHPLAPGEGGTLANAVVARYPECAAASPDPREGGAAQRLDAGTSGCVVFARDRAAWDDIHEALRARMVEKIYLALVHGRLASGGVVSVPLGQRGGRAVPAPDELAADRLRAKGASVRPAETHYDVERAFERFTLLRVRIVTGVMHQIRAHLAYLGHPVAGDGGYGGAAGAPEGLRRPFLHASRIALEAPGGGRIEAESPLPADLEAVLRTLMLQASRNCP